MSQTEASITPEEQVSRIFAWRRGFNATHLIDIGIRLGLFRAFAQTPGASAGEVARRLGLHLPYVRTWCVTAYGFELLEAGDEEHFSLAPHIDQVLAMPSHSRYMGGYVRLGTEFASEDFRRCEEAFRTGETLPYQGRSEAFARVVAEATAGLQVLCARKLLPELPDLKPRLDAGGTILEVGCGTGTHLLRLAKSFPGARCVGVDIDPTGTAIARASIREAGLDLRVTVLEGDVAEVVQPASCTCVVMIEVLHEIAPHLRPHVLGACSRALDAGGWLLIVDETYPTTLAQARVPEFRFPLQTGFEELLWGNVLPTREEQESLLHDAGFSGGIRREMIGEGFTVLAARKPQIR